MQQTGRYCRQKYRFFAYFQPTLRLVVGFIFALIYRLFAILPINATAYTNTCLTKSVKM